MGAVATWGAAVAGRKTIIESPYLVDAVADIAALSALVVTGFSDGAHAWVASVRDFYTLRTSADAASPMLIAASATAGRVWYRCCTPDPSWARQDYFEVDPASGSDEATGAVGVPVRTVNEVVRRLGHRYHVKNYSANFAVARIQVVKVLGTAAESVFWDISADQNTRLHLQGTLSAASYTGVINTPTALNLATNTQTAATVTPAWTPATELRRICKTTIGGNEYRAFVIKDNTGGSARLSPWLQHNGSSTGAGDTMGNAVAATAITTHTFTGRVQHLNVRVASDYNASTPFVVSDLDIYGTLISVPTGAQFHMVSCLLQDVYAGHGATYFHNCLQKGGGQIGNDAPSFVSYNGGARMDTAMTQQPRYSECVFQYGHVFQGVGLTVINGMARITTGGASFCDITGDAITLKNNSWIRISVAPAGNNNTGYGIRFEPGCYGTYLRSITATLTGASGDFCFGTTAGLPAPATKTTSRGYDTTLGSEGPAVTLSWANLVATYAGGGFAGSIQDRDTGCKLTVVN